ncbi:MAG: ADP-glyceromanno-heptose 6-epimerase [Chlamydiota bacterium]
MSDQPLIVVTGAAGFIGSGLVRYLNDRGNHHLVLVDNIYKTDKWKNLLGKKYVDFLSVEGLFPWLEGREKEIAAFIHLGGCSDTLEADGDYLMENNFRYTRRLAEYALKHNQRFIYASSAATYGDGSLGFSDNHDLLDDLRPLNAYGFSKHIFDVWAKREGVLDKLVGLKYFNIFGPNEQHKGRMASMVYKMLPSVLNEGVVRLFKSTEPEKFADGGQCRDFLYVKDAVKMTCNFLENGIGGIFNIGQGQATTWNTLATALFKAADKPVCIEYIEMSTDLAKQYQNYTCADMQKYCVMHGISSSKIPFEYTVESAVIDNVRSYLLKDERW